MLVLLAAFSRYRLPAARQGAGGRAGRGRRTRRDGQAGQQQTQRLEAPQLLKATLRRPAAPHARSPCSTSPTLLPQSARPTATRSSALGAGLPLSSAIRFFNRSFTLRQPWYSPCLAGEAAWQRVTAGQRGWASAGGGMVGSCSPAAAAQPLDTHLVHDRQAQDVLVVQRLDGGLHAAACRRRAGHRAGQGVGGAAAQAARLPWLEPQTAWLHRRCIGAAAMARLG